MRRFSSLVPAAATRLWRSLVTLPDLKGWRFAALAGAATLACEAAVGFAGGLLHLQTPDLAGLPLRMVTVIFVPALGEEALFRGLLVPGRSETARPAVVIAAATVIFTAWHVAETLFLKNAAQTFLRPDFLITVVILGVGCGIIRWRTGSLWPCIVVHWIEVVAWQTWLGGSGVDALK